MVKPTSYAAIKNAPLVGLAEGNGQFSNPLLALVVLSIPFILQRFIFFGVGGWTVYFLIFAITAVPSTVGYWYFMSVGGSRIDEKVKLPGKNLEEYITIHDPELKAKYHGKNKIPMQIFHDAYFDGKIDFNGDCLDIMEQRHDWASFTMTLTLFKYVFTQLIPDVIFHTREQDLSQVREHYDRGDDFYSWFLGPRMIYTSGVIGDANKEETLEELQDNKLAVVCGKLDLQEGDRLLDIGCGWGTLVTYAAKNFGCDATGVTLSENQTKFGNDRIASNGVSPSLARILCSDFRDLLPGSGRPHAKPKGSYNKIVSLEMAEHVGLRRYSEFLGQVYELLDDDGVFVLQVAGIRARWQFEDLVWGLFMNKYVFPGADASASLGWVINKLQDAGFEIRSCDVLGVHYSATIYRWYQNWLKHESEVKEKYGDWWWRVWLVFLGWSTIISRQGSFSVFQITMHKNLNAFHRVEGVKSHRSVHLPQNPNVQLVE